MKCDTLEPSVASHDPFTRMMWVPPLSSQDSRLFPAPVRTSVHDCGAVCSSPAQVKSVMTLSGPERVRIRYAAPSGAFASVNSALPRGGVESQLSSRRITSVRPLGSQEMTLSLPLRVTVQSPTAAPAWLVDVARSAATNRVVNTATARPSETNGVSRRGAVVIG